MLKIPLVSFIIPTYNSGKSIVRCLKSVSNQTYSNIEIIIIDDHSNDDTLLKIEKLNLKNLIIIKKKENHGPSKCRNDGISACNGKYISILDSDDYIFPTKTYKQINFMENNKEYSVVGSNVIIKNNNHEVVSKRKETHTDIMKTIFFYNPFCHSSLIFKKNDFLNTDMYDEKVFFGEDHRLIAQLLTLGKGFNLQETLVKKYEIFGTSISTKTKKIKLISYLFNNRIFIFKTFRKNKFSITFIKSVIALLFLCLVYTLNLDKEKIRNFMR